MSDLKECPFCRGIVERYNGLSHCYKCTDCGVIVRFSIKSDKLVALAESGLVIGGTAEWYEDGDAQWNARHEQTCHMVFNDPKDPKCRCDACGFNYSIGDDVAWHGNRFIYLWDYCKGCGAKVVDE